MIIGQVILECLTIVSVGVVAGLLLGVVGVALLQDGIDLSAWAAGVEAFHLQAILVPRMLVTDLVLVAGLSLLFGLVASAYPAGRAVRINPLDAMRR